MAKKNGLQTPVIILILAGILLLCCCPGTVIGLSAIIYLNDPESPLDSEPNPATVADPGQSDLEEVSIVTQNEFNEAQSQDFLTEVLSDESIVPLFEWAADEGYIELETPVGGGAEVVYSDGSTLRGVVYGSIQILQFSDPEWSSSGYILSRFGGSEDEPRWILFNQDGRAEISEEGISVFDSDGSRLGRTKFSALADGISRNDLSPAGVTQCTTTGWGEFLKCLERQGFQFVLGSFCGVAIVGGAAACVKAGAFTLGGACLAAIAGITVACGVVPLICVKPALYDDLPQATIGLWSDSGEKRWIAGGTNPDTNTNILGYIQATVWRAKLTVTDDREPAPSIKPPTDWVTAASGECETIEIEDCGGNRIRPSFCAPPVTDAEKGTWRFTNPDQAEDPNDPLPTEALPTEQVTSPIEISYAGKYTGVMSKESSSATWTCSSNDQYWSDVVFTYKFNLDDSVTLVGVISNGEELTGGPWSTYVPGDEGTYVNNSTTSGGSFTETLRFSNTDLKIERYHLANDGTSGTCKVTLKVVPE